MTEVMRFQASVPVILRQRAETDPDGILLQNVEGASLTNRRFQEEVDEIAYTLVSLGVGRDDRVVTVLDPCLASHTLWIATCWIGAMEVPVNPEFRGNSLIYGISDCKARLLITSNDHLARIGAIRDQLPFVQHALTIDEEVPEGYGSWVRTLASARRSAEPSELRAPTIEAPYAVIYTSGTTGPSKGVVVPWGSLQSAPQHMYAGFDPAKVGPEGVVYYSPWPTFHASGRCGLAVVALWGGRMVIRKRLSIGNYWDDIRKFGCTHTQTMGLADFLMAQPEKDNDADNPLGWVVMNPVIGRYREFEARFGVKVSTGWGMTEIGLPLNGADLPNAQTCGKLSSLYDVRIVDDQEADVPEGEVGQLLIRPKHRWLLLSQYLDKPEATKKSWSGDWFKTGDALKRDTDGNYYFVDRVADYLRVRGNNISSVELEAEVRAHPSVLDCAAIGVSGGQLEPEGRRGNVTLAATTEDEIKVVVILNDGAELTGDELTAFLAPRLPRFMVPRYIQFAAEVPRTPTGKIQKKLLRETPPPSPIWDRFEAGIELPK